MGDLERGREFFDRRAWASAHEAFTCADGPGELGRDDLERFAVSAYLIGRDDEYLELLKRAFQASVAEEHASAAARAAFWIGLRLLFRGERAQASGWLARAQRSLDQERRDAVERGYLLLAETQVCIDSGELDAAADHATNALSIGERFRDADLLAVARHLVGRIRLNQGKLHEGLVLLDETMVAVAGGELSPLVTGLVYCSVIDGCREVYAFDRAREWTAALSRWCESLPEMVAFSGICAVHRAEIFELHGAWPEALAQAERAVLRCRQSNATATAEAFYVQGNVHRLRGELDAAEEAFRKASESGKEPQPGLSLLRLAQGRNASAEGSIRRALGATSDAFRRLTVLPAYIEIMLAGGAVGDAESACRELENSAERLESELLRAEALTASGALNLVQGNSSAALAALEAGRKIWQAIGAPYRAARVQLLIGRCCRALDDDDGATFAEAAARAVFLRLGARPELALLGGSSSDPERGSSVRLTARELEVLRMVAAGETNKRIAATLSLSEKTIERHLSNIFTKLDVASRTAATAYAYQHHLV